MPVEVDPRALAEVDEHPFPLLFVTVSGAHLYGFASRDSDWDLRGAHTLPLADVIGLEEGRETHGGSPERAGGPPLRLVEAVEASDPGERSGGPKLAKARHTIEVSKVREGCEVDLVTHDVKKFFTLLLRRNGYVLEQLCSPIIVRTTPEHVEARALVPGLLTRHHAHHYLGFARTQWALFAKGTPPRVKPLLYVYRVLLTGLHLMRAGEVEANLERLNREARLPQVPDLLELKRLGPEKGALAAADLPFHEAEVQRLVADLEEAMKTTSLPDVPRPEARAALNDLLVRVRLGR